MVDQKKNALFPPWLNKESRGAAVVHLQVILIELCNLDPGHPSFIWGDYNDLVAEAVKRLQSETLNFDEKDVDGNFGQGTRAAYLKEFEIDLNTIPGFGGRTQWAGPDHYGLKLWPLVSGPDDDIEIPGGRLA